MTAVSKLRSAWKERGDEPMPSINDFILQASARALKDFPQVNSNFTEQGIRSTPTSTSASRWRSMKGSWCR